MKKFLISEYNDLKDLSDYEKVTSYSEWMENFSK